MWKTFLCAVSGAIWAALLAIDLDIARIADILERLLHQ